MMLREKIEQELHLAFTHGGRYQKYNRGDAADRILATVREAMGERGQYVTLDSYEIGTVGMGGFHRLVIRKSGNDGREPIFAEIDAKTAREWVGELQQFIAFTETQS